jgi:hypothetical protein
MDKGQVEDLVGMMRTLRESRAQDQQNNGKTV